MEGRKGRKGVRSVHGPARKPLMVFKSMERHKLRLLVNSTSKWMIDWRGQVDQNRHA